MGGFNKERKKIEKAMSKCLSIKNFESQLKEINAGYNFLERLKKIAKKEKREKELMGLENRLRQLAIGLFVQALIEKRKEHHASITNCLEEIFEIAKKYDVINKLQLNHEKILGAVFNAYNALNKMLNDSYNTMVKNHINKTYTSDCLINFYNAHCNLKEISLLTEITEITKGTELKKLQDAIGYGIAYLYAASQSSNLDPILDKTSSPFILYSNDGLDDYNIVKSIIIGLIEDIAKETEDKNMKKNLEEKLKQCDKIVNENAEHKVKIIGADQDFYQEKAEQLAKEGNPKYRFYLDRFIELTRKHSKILEEEDEDVGYMLNVYNPDLHVNINAEARKKGKTTLPLYEFYKTLPENSLAKIVIDIQLSYVRANKKKGEKKEEEKEEKDE